MDKPFEKVDCTSCGRRQIKYQVGKDGRCVPCTVFDRKAADFPAPKAPSRSR